LHVALQNASARQVLSYLRRVCHSDPDGLQIERLDAMVYRGFHGCSGRYDRRRVAYMTVGHTSDGDPQSGNTCYDEYRKAGVVRQRNGKFMVFTWSESYRTGAG
jgi:hypothetical protein